MPSNEFTVGIIAAMAIEADGIKSCMEDTSSEIISGIEFVSGRLSGKKVIVAVCGIGKVFAAICAQTMILRYSPDLIINSGVAGTLTENLSVGDIAIAVSLVQHDMDTSALGDPVGLISGINIVNLPCDKKYSALLLDCAKLLGANCLSGVIASGDRFMSNSAEKSLIVERFRAIACEMEGASIGQVCYVNGVSCCVMRAISDGGDENAAVDYPVFASIAASRAVEVVTLFFKKLLNI